MRMTGEKIAFLFEYIEIREKNFERLAVSAGGLSGLARCRCPYTIQLADFVTRPRRVINLSLFFHKVTK